MSPLPPFPPAFLCLAPRALPGGAGLWLRHRASGAEVLWQPHTGGEAVLSVSFPLWHRRSDGAAHLLEHMIFRGARGRRAHALLPLLQGVTLASHLNATTGPDQIAYHAAAPCGAELAALSALLLEAIFDPRLGDEDVAEEREVVRHEMTGYLADPRARAELALKAALLGPGNGAGRNQGGNPGQIARLRRADLIALHRASHAPSRARIWLEGDGAVLETLDHALSRYSGRFPALPPPPHLPRAVPPGRPRRVTLPARAGESELALVGFVLPDDLSLFERAMLRELLVGELAGALGADLLAAGPYGLLSLRFATAPDPALLRAELAARAGRLCLAELRSAARRAELSLRDADTGPRKPEGLRRAAAQLSLWHQRGTPPEAGDPTIPPLKAADVVLWRARLCRLLADNPGPVTLHLRPRAGDVPRGPVPPRLQAEPLLPDPRAPQDAPPLLRPDGPLPPLPPPLAPLRREGFLHLPPAEDGLSRIALALAPLEPGTPEASLPGRARALVQRCADLPLTPDLRVSAEPGGWLLLEARVLPRDQARALDALAARLALALADRVAPPPDGGARARLSARLLHQPQHLIDLRLRAPFDPQAAVADRLAGPGHLLSAAAPPVGVGPLGLVTLALSAPGDAGVGGLIAALPVARQPALRPVPGPRPGAEAFVAPMGLSAAGIGWQLSAGIDAGAARIALRAAEAEWLWPQIRARGGAYGLRTGADRGGRMWAFAVRDPWPLRSLAILRALPAFLRANADEGLLARARRGAAAALIAPLAPAAALGAALRAALTGPEPDATRAELWEAIGRSTLCDLRRATDAMAADLAQGHQLVLTDPATRLPPDWQRHDLRGPPALPF